jgi:hypothetical protein
MSLALGPLCSRHKRPHQFAVKNRCMLTCFSWHCVQAPRRADGIGSTAAALLGLTPAAAANNSSGSGGGSGGSSGGVAADAVGGDAARRKHSSFVRNIVAAPAAVREMPY